MTGRPSPRRARRSRRRPAGRTRTSEPPCVRVTLTRARPGCPLHCAGRERLAGRPREAPRGAAQTSPGPGWILHSRRDLLPPAAGAGMPPSTHSPPPPTLSREPPRGLMGGRRPSTARHCRPGDRDWAAGPTEGPGAGLRPGPASTTSFLSHEHRGPASLPTVTSPSRSHSGWKVTSAGTVTVHRTPGPARRN